MLTAEPVRDRGTLSLKQAGFHPASLPEDIQTLSKILGATRNPDSLTQVVLFDKMNPDHISRTVEAHFISGLQSETAALFYAGLIRTHFMGGKDTVNIYWQDIETGYFEENLAKLRNIQNSKGLREIAGYQFQPGKRVKTIFQRPNLYH